MVSPPFYDVNGDFAISQTDLLGVWNAIHAQSAPPMAAPIVPAIPTLDEFMATLEEDDLACLLLDLEFCLT
jgi:hypothetical protein